VPPPSYKDASGWTATRDQAPERDLRFANAHEDARHEFWTETTAIREHPVDERTDRRHETSALRFDQEAKGSPDGQGKVARHLPCGTLVEQDPRTGRRDGKRDGRAFSRIEVRRSRVDGLPRIESDTAKSAQLIRFHRSNLVAEFVPHLHRDENSIEEFIKEPKLSDSDESDDG
jgi:hypothetical protein